MNKMKKKKDRYENKDYFCFSITKTNG